MLNGWTGGWLGGAAVVGVLAALWGRFQMILWRIANLLVVRIRLECGMGVALSALCWSDFKRSPFGEKKYESSDDFVQPLDRYQVVGYEMLGTDPTVFWRGWRPLFLNFSAPAGDVKSYGISLTATFIRGTFDPDALLIEALDRLNEYRHGHRDGDGGNRFRVDRSFGYGHRRGWKGEDGSDKASSSGPELVKGRNDPDRRYLKWKKGEIGMKCQSANPFGILAYPKEVLVVVKRCQRWLDSEGWYKGKEIPWRLGVLLHGKPGTGKTSLVRGIGRKLDLPITSFDLASFGNREFEQAWQRMLNSTPCIALVEDIDAVFDGRENRLGEEGGGLTFDCLLNCIGGAKDADGILLFVTTNHPDCLDEALGKPDGEGGSTRPGRIDMVAELGPLDEECRRRLAEKILSDCPHLVESLVMEGEGDSGAQFSERCSSVALEHYWEGKDDRTGNLARTPGRGLFGANGLDGQE